MWFSFKAYFSDDWTLEGSNVIEYHDDDYVPCGYGLRVLLRHKITGKPKQLKIGNPRWIYQSLLQVRCRLFVKYGLVFEVKENKVGLVARPT